MNEQDGKKALDDMVEEYGLRPVAVQKTDDGEFRITFRGDRTGRHYTVRVDEKTFLEAAEQVKGR